MMLIKIICVYICTTVHHGVYVPLQNKNNKKANKLQIYTIFKSQQKKTAFQALKITWVAIKEGKFHCLYFPCTHFHSPLLHISIFNMPSKYVSLKKKNNNNYLIFFFFIFFLLQEQVDHLLLQKVKMLYSHVL